MTNVQTIKDSSIDNYFMVSAGKMPFHGKLIERPYLSVQEALEEAGILWDVEKRDSYTLDGEGNHILNPKSKCIVRVPDNKVLGTVGVRYEPIQNLDAFGYLDEFIGDEQLKIVAAGVLDDGAQIWALAQLPQCIEPVRGDRTVNYLFLRNSHNGSTSFEIAVTPTRITCNNMIRLAMCKKSTTLKIRHTKNAGAKIKQTAAAIQHAHEAFENYGAFATSLAGYDMKKFRWNKFSKQMFPNPVKGIDGEINENKLTRARNNRSKLTELFETGMGTQIPGVRGTAWGAFNAVTEFANYERGRSEDSRFKSLLFGSQASDGAALVKNAYVHLGGLLN